MAECVVVKFSSDTLGAQIEDVSNNAQEENENTSNVPVFGFYHIICLALSIATYVVDMGFDSWLAYLYYLKGEGIPFALTVTFIVFPAIITTAFSMRWYIIDGDEPSLPKPALWKWVLRIIILLLQLAPILRVMVIWCKGIKAKSLKELYLNDD